MNNSLLGIPVGVPSMDEALSRALSAIDRKVPQIVFSCAMAHSINTAQKDREFREALIDSDMVVTDGAGVALMGRLVGLDLGERIAGEQFFLALMRALSERGRGRIFFFGSTDRVLELIRKRFAQEFPELEVCGTLAPPLWPWPEDTDQRMIREIRETQPDVLWIGLGAPKQEKWAYRNRHALGTPLIGSIGAVFDYFAGTNPPPPGWVRRFGLETLYRFIREPRRLWRRVFISNSQFVTNVLLTHFLHMRR